MYKRIPISGNRGKNMYALVDADMYPELSGRKWWLSDHGYAKSESRASGKRETIWMHRFVMDCPDHLVTHHVNGNPLDNRRCNLGNTTQRHNMHARVGQGGTSNYKGVYWNSTTHRWIAAIMVNDRRKQIGSYHSEKAAALAYNLAAIRTFGEHAFFNDVSGEQSHNDALISLYTNGHVPFPATLPLPEPDRPKYTRVSLRGKLGLGKFALIDTADLPLVNDRRWWCSRQGYATGHITIDGRKIHLKMHRLILDAPPGGEVDHINGNKLDNRRSNLRLVTRNQNMHNSKTRKGKFKGVFLKGNGWQASITVDRRQIYLGFFDTQREAAAAYNEAAKKYHGDFARLNDLSSIDPQDDPPIRTKQTSKYKGVGYHKKQRKWNAYAFVNGEQVSIGSFDTEHEAALARDQYVIDNSLRLKLNVLVR